MTYDSLTPKVRTNLVIEGKGFGLPSTDPESLAILAAIRVARVEHIVNEQGYDSDVPSPSLVLSPSLPQPCADDSDGGRTVTFGFYDIMALLERNNRSVTPVNTPAFPQAKLIAASVIDIAFNKIFPAYHFISMVVRDHAVSRAASQVCNSGSANFFKKSWEGRRGHKENASAVISDLRRSHPVIGARSMGLLTRIVTLPWAAADCILSLEQRRCLAHLEQEYDITTIAGAVERAKEGLLLLEGFLRGIGYSGTVTHEHPLYSFGSHQPSYLDCVIFAATSCMLYSEFKGRGAAQVVGEWQTEVRENVPLLISLTESVRQTIFENHAYFRLKQIPYMSQTSNYDVDKAFSEGRASFMVTTLAFTAFYFIVVNAGTILEILQVMIDNRQMEGAVEAAADGSETSDDIIAKEQ